MVDSLQITVLFNRTVDIVEDNTNDSYPTQSSPVSKVLCVKSSDTSPAVLPFALNVNVEVVCVDDFEQAIELLRKEEFDGFYYCHHHQLPHSTEDLLFNSKILDKIPQGVALVDSDNKIISANSRLTEWCEKPGLVGLNFYESLNNPEIVSGPNELTPLMTSRSSGQDAKSTLRCGERIYQMTVMPMKDESEEGFYLLVSLVDTTATFLFQQKMKALHKAGGSLADLSPKEIYEMDYDQRVEIIKDNILHFTQDLLDFEVVEIRLIDPETNDLKPLLSVGIDSGVERKMLKAESTGNGVTGFVAATGKSYLCEDTTNDPLYLDGLIGAKSSLTVPLIYHDEILGSFNVESPEPNAFSNDDLLFVEAFVGDISGALNTLNLLTAQQNDAKINSVSEIQAAVAVPIDEILNEAVQVIESSLGASLDVEDRLRGILDRARRIKRVIQEIVHDTAPKAELCSSIQVAKHPLLDGKRVLVIDADKKVRTSAHQMLEKYGCDVETAMDGHQAILMIQSRQKGGMCSEDGSYDAIIADIRLPDIKGYDLLMALKDFIVDPPLILMTGFGYDLGHSIVKARKAGLKTSALLYKPFRLEDLLNRLETIVSR